MCACTGVACPLATPNVPTIQYAESILTPGNQNQRDAAEEAGYLRDQLAIWIQRGLLRSKRNFPPSIELRRRTERHDAVSATHAVEALPFRLCAIAPACTRVSRAGRDDSGHCPNGMAGAAATDDVRHDSPET